LPKWRERYSGVYNEKGLMSQDFSRSAEHRAEKRTVGRPYSRMDPAWEEGF